MGVKHPLSSPGPRVSGKLLWTASGALHVRGVTYGSFEPNERGDEFPEPAIVADDFASMAAAGLNAIRTYTVPPVWLLDLAAEHELHVLVGIPWEEHVAFLDERGRAEAIEAKVRSAVRSCAGHAAVLAYAVGNEIPAAIVRWLGRRRVETFVERLYRAAKEEDPDGLVTYVSYPSTEYLRLPFLDFACFNVFLEDDAEFAAYLARLHNLVGDTPLVVGELGLDSGRHGTAEQAERLARQINATFESGCAGAFVFSWTDEWHRGGNDVSDWQFGLVTDDRSPKPALAAVSHSFTEAPFSNGHVWPRVSVVVCTHNGSRTLRHCLEAVCALDYPDFEVVVVDDGSSDSSAAIAGEFGARLIRTENRGLSSARNTGLEAAMGEIVAYLDDDAWPDPGWLRYLALTFAQADVRSRRWPQPRPPDDPTVAQCVANSPGGPIHVLLSDTEAEHIPGCNMAFRKTCLEEIGGFDPQFRIAGDDVDVCWRLQDYGWTLGFSPSAVMWHRRRASVRGYLRQQRDYGRAEALLERKWPEKYNAVGHVSWAGRLYGRVPSLRLRRRTKIRYGIWGTGAFQTAVEPGRSTVSAISGMPEWYLLIALLAGVGALGVLWRPLYLSLPLLALAVIMLLAQAVAGSMRARFAGHRLGQHCPRLRALTMGLFVLQPIARLWGRIGYGLTPWRHRSPRGLAFPSPRQRTTWSEKWVAPEERLRALAAGLGRDGAVVRHGGAEDRWDLEVRGGAFGATRLRTAVEEHGSGRQLARFRTWPIVSPLGILLVAVFAPLALWAGLASADAAAAVLGGFALLVTLVTLQDCASSTAALLRGIERSELPESAIAEVNGNGQGVANLNGRSVVRLPTRGKSS